MQTWVKIRKELYKQVEHRVRHLLGESNAGFARYRSDYEREFQRPWKVSSKATLVERLHASQIVYIGDFHALQQSQKAQLRVLKTIPSERDLVLAVEFFEARHQKWIDAVLQGKMSEREFLKAIEWKKSWGFPWEFYRPLLRWAQKRKVRLYGINLKREDRTTGSLQARDRFAGEKIADIVKSHPDSQVVVLFGDLHLATEHLPQQVRRVLRKKTPAELFIFQNSERIYFQLLEKGQEVQTDVVRLTANKFCLLNVPPWVKWQNYLLFLEQSLDSRIDPADIDFTDDVARFVKVIAQDLDLNIPEGGFSIYSARDGQFWDQIKRATNNEKQLRWLETYIEESVSFYWPEKGLGYLARPTVNHAASLAMGIIHAHLAKHRQAPWDMPEDFTRLIWCEAVQYFGSKFINPKRKTDTLMDLKANLAVKQISDPEKEALQLALAQKMQEMLTLSGLRKSRDIMRPRRKVSYREAARILGGMLGEKLFFAYRKNLISKNTLLVLLRKPVDSDQFKHIYYEILEVIESLPEPFISKSEKL